ncbi:TonB-dependent receptor [Cytophagaceae bacterium DM2B3-1]|uniref:TonB-dependent receptor n=1 Tax=Xanthocytophaga flava TaxID=3048013 RepID=A0ABT7CJA1_9BACT|nr:TonB-dependent receptor [Xanthocytophaga flavus]MDJ1493798.1 TonB-dependent receptor [Xanthocytophaga flavus]
MIPYIYKKVFYIGFLLVLLLQETVAQTSIQGSVVDKNKLHPLEFSTVTLHRLQDSSLVAGTAADAKGTFTLTDIKAGRYYMIVQFLGYKPFKVPTITISGDKVYTIGQIALEASPALLNEIIIKGEKAATYHHIDKQVYNAAQFQSAQGGTATDVLKNLPSISVNSEGDITMRGSSSFIVLLDGKPVQSDPGIILNQLPANTIENVEVITTPSSKYDPDGKSGIINITTKKGATDGYYILTNAQIGLPSVQDYGNENRPVRFGGDVTANYKKAKWNVSLGANYKRDDIAGYRDGEAKTYLNTIYTTFPSLGERSYYSYSYSVKGVVSYQISPSNTLEAGFYAGKKSQFRKADILYKQQRSNEATGELLNSFDYFNQNLRERRGDFVVSNLDYSHLFSDKSVLTVSALYEKTILGGPTNNKDVNPELHSQLYNQAVMDESNPLDGFRFKTDYSKSIGKKGKFEGGYQYRYLLHKGDFTYREYNPSSKTWSVREDLSNEVKLIRHIHSLYGQYSAEIGKLSYTAGLRTEFIDRTLEDKSTSTPYTFNRVNLFPSANLLYTITKDFKLKAGYSRRIVHTTSNMMNPFPARRHSEVLEVGDPKLLPEYIDLAEIGVVKNIGFHSVFANVYYRGVQHVINRVNTVYNDTILIRTYTNAGKATSYGIEAGLDLKLAEWWTFFAGGNVYQYAIRGGVFNTAVQTNSINYSVNGNTTIRVFPSLTFQVNVNYTSRTVTAQGEDSRFLIPSATLKKTLWKGQGSVSLQWQNIDLGMLGSNEQRLTTHGSNFYTSTNYIQEVDVFRLNFSYQFNKLSKKLKFTESEFGEKEF